MKTPHKFCELIKAWADGAKIQVQLVSKKDQWHDSPNPCWINDYNYRVKPEPKVYEYQFVKSPTGNLQVCSPAVATNLQQNQNWKILSPVLRFEYEDSNG